MAPARASADAGGTNTAAADEPITSGTPPTRVATMGRSACSASSSALGQSLAAGREHQEVELTVDGADVLDV